MKLLKIFTFFVFVTLTAQLRVTDDSYIYVKNNFITVQQNINLSSTGFIHLREDGQLLQINNASPNTGFGALSVYQRGTAGVHHYNYWCSPIGLRTNVENTNFGINLIKRPLTATTSEDINIIGGFNGFTDNNSLNIPSYWVYKFTGGTVYANWEQVLDASTIAPGYGFTMKGVAGTDNTTPIAGLGFNNPSNAQRYEFRGKPNNGTITIPVATDQFTLIGNPYPSAINLRWFLVGNGGSIPGNPNSTGVAYFWEHDKTANSHNIVDYIGGYGTYAGGTGIYTVAPFFSYNLDGSTTNANVGIGNNFERLFTPIGQGFMIRGANNGNVVMRNEYRVFRRQGASFNSQFERGIQPQSTAQITNEFVPNVAGVSLYETDSKPSPHIKINTLIAGSSLVQTAISFEPEATNGLDWSKDAESMNKILAGDAFYWVENKELAQASIPYYAENFVPIAFRTNSEKTFEIKVSEIYNLDNNLKVYLHKIATNEYFDIKNQSHSFTLPAGVHKDLYQITFTNQTLSVNPFNVQQNFIVAFDKNIETIKVKIPRLNELDRLFMFDVNGKLIVSDYQKYDDHVTLSSSRYASSVYFIKVTYKDGTTQVGKIVLN